MHIPVMLEEVIEGLHLKPGARVIDCTVGGGGHSEAILQKIGQTGALLGLDRDSSTLKQAQKRLTTYHNAKFVHADFDCLEDVAVEHDFKAVDGILLDLGFSSLQLDDPARGLSFQSDGPLDMRLDQSARHTAEDLIKKGSERQLADIFYRYGELYDAKRFAKQIVETRHKAPITTTLELVERLGLKNPGVKAKLFQALRIAVNDELAQLEQVIPQAVSLLNPGGRLAIITFHSLEDRIVKNLFKNNHLLTLVNKKPLEPSEAEVSQNPRSRSAKLRIAEKIVG
jgi:16S rRNA (cytosine1402-N4)-methyltransferase